MNKLLFSVILIAILIGCKEEKGVINGFSIEVLNLDGNSSVVGKDIECLFHFNGCKESNLPVSFSLEGGSGFVTVNDKKYEVGETFNCDVSNALVVYTPTTEGTHTVTFTVKDSDKLYSEFVSFQITKPKLNVEIEDLESSVSLGRIARFRIVVDTDMDEVFCMARISKGSGSLSIEGQDITPEKIISLQKDNQVLLTPDTPGEIRIDFRIYGNYGDEVRYTVAILAQENS